MGLSRERHNLSMDNLFKKHKLKLKVKINQLDGLLHHFFLWYLYCRSQCLLDQLPNQVLLLRHQQLQCLQQRSRIWNFKDLNIFIFIFTSVRQHGFTFSAMIRSADLCLEFQVNKKTTLGPTGWKLNVEQFRLLGWFDRAQIV